MPAAPRTAASSSSRNKRSQGFDHDYTRNIHLGLFCPEIFDLPEGYRMITIDFGDAMRRMDQMEKGMDIQNKSVEELLKML